MISVSVESSPLPSAVLSITSTPIVCVVLTRQGINWVLLMYAFYSVPLEQRAPAPPLQGSLPVKATLNHFVH